MEARFKNYLIEFFKNQASATPNSALRRNLACALFYTGQEQNRVHWDNSEIDQIDILRTVFRACSISSCALTQLHVQKCVFEDFKLNEVKVSDCLFVNLQANNCVLKAIVEGTNVSSLTIADSSLDIVESECVFEDINLNRCNGSVCIGGDFLRLNVKESKLRLTGLEGKCSDFSLNKGRYDIAGRGCS